MDAVRKATEEALASGDYVSDRAIMDKVFGVKGRNMAGQTMEYINAMGNTGDWLAFIRNLAEGHKKLSALERFGSVLGINSNLSNAVSGTTTGATPTSSAAADNASASASAIATGGTRSTTVNIKIEKGIGDVYFQGSTRENQSEIERNLAESLYRILGMAETAAM
jgi:hypothetical protein